MIRKDWMSFEIEVLRFALNNGNSLREVAVVFGRSLSSVRAMAYKLKRNEYLVNLKFGE